MDFDQLESFLEVARHSSFSRAAEKRFRTQPAISSQIRALEEEVGAKLFDRSGGKVALTGAGKVFQKYAEQTLDSIIDNSVDFGVVSAPVDDKRLTVVNIHRDELVIIAAPGHPLSCLKEASIADVVCFPLLLPKVGRTRDAIENLFDERRLKPKISMELDSSELLKRFVAADVG